MYSRSETEKDVEVEKENLNFSSPYNGSLFDLMLNASIMKEDNESIITDEDGIFFNYRSPSQLNIGGATLFNYPHPPQMPPTTEIIRALNVIGRAPTANGGRFEKINSTHDFDPLLKTFLDWSQHQPSKNFDTDTDFKSKLSKVENVPKFTDAKTPLAAALRAVKARQVIETTWKKGVTKIPIKTRGPITI
ncbi:hypothetical protein CHUAL_012036 [Chamberlinius hualienensis]